VVGGIVVGGTVAVVGAGRALAPTRARGEADGVVSTTMVAMLARATAVRTVNTRRGRDTVLPFSPRPLEWSASN
jgi:hypothetical protein